MYLSIGKVSELMGVSPSTLRRWDHKKQFCSSFKTAGKHRRYLLNDILQFINKIAKPEIKITIKPKPQAIIYCRISSSKQRKDLQTQQLHLEHFVKKKDWELCQVYKDIGSGLNDNRAGLLRLIRDLPVLQPQKLVISYPDRLARFGLRLIQQICNFFQIKIVCTHVSETTPSLESQLTHDVIAMLTSFAGKLHRSRRGQQNLI